MANDWAPEPWRYNKGIAIRIIYAANGRQVTYSSEPPLHQNITDFDRIIACVNACEGVPTGRLEETVTLGVAKLAEIALSKEAPDGHSDEG